MVKWALIGVVTTVPGSRFAKITLNEISSIKPHDTIIAHTGFASKGFARLKVTKVFYEGCPTYTVVHFKTEAVQ